MSNKVLLDHIRTVFNRYYKYYTEEEVAYGVQVYLSGGDLTTCLLRYRNDKNIQVSNLRETAAILGSD